jgi:TolB protein
MSISEQKSDRGEARKRLGRWALLLAVVLVTGVISWLGARLTAPAPSITQDPTLLAIATVWSRTATPSSTTIPAPALPSFTPPPTAVALQGTLIYALRDQGHTHIWAYLPGTSQAFALTAGAWDDRDPAISYDGKQLAFSSHRDGNWDLYILDLISGDIRRITETPGYEGHPTWSPDGQWLAYEAYYSDNFDIWIAPLESNQPPIQLTYDAADDASPVWDPGGRRVAFVSDRDGSPDIFIADLNKPDNRLTNLTNTPDRSESSPAFSPDGQSLAFAARSDGVDSLMVLDPIDSQTHPVMVGQGGRPAWSPSGDGLLAIAFMPFHSYLQSYTLRNAGTPLIGAPPPGEILSVCWTALALPGQAQARSDSLATAQPLADATFASGAEGNARHSLLPLANIQAPRARLSDAVQPAFSELRLRVAADLGWDFLAQLENAYVGLNDPLPPGYETGDWLRTGRAFSLSQAAIQAGWVKVVRQDFAGETYWRVYVRANVQDGSLGEPLRERPWDFSTRFSGNPEAYDQGGSLTAQIPPGYYVDFTQLAADYGFERLPAMPDWRTYFPGARYTEFARTDGLDWRTAMLQLYPPEAIVTATPFKTPTLTPTRTPWPTPTPWWWRYITLTPSSTPTALP